MVFWKKKRKNNIFFLQPWPPQKPKLGFHLHPGRFFLPNLTFSAMGPNDKDFGKWSEPNLQGIMFHSYPIHLGVSKNSGTPKWMVIVENPIKMDDLEENPLFLETSISPACHPLESLFGFTSPGNASRRINSLGVKSLSSSASGGELDGKQRKTNQRCLFFLGWEGCLGIMYICIIMFHMWWKSTYIEIYIGSFCLFACLFVSPCCYKKSHDTIYSNFKFTCFISKEVIVFFRKISLIHPLLWDWLRSNISSFHRTFQAPKMEVLTYISCI